MAVDGYAETAIFATILCILLFYYCHWRWNIKHAGPITNWPLVGMLPGLLSNASRIHDFAADVITKGGNTILVKGPWFTNLNFICTSDPENLHYALSTNFANYQKGPAFREIFDVLGDGILIAESESWKAQRKLIHALFKDDKFLQLVENATREKVEKGLFPILEQGTMGVVVDMQDLLQRFTFDLTCILLFDFDPNSLSLSLPHVLISTALDEIEEAMIQRHVLPHSVWKLLERLQIGKEKKVTSAKNAFDNFIYHHISLKRELKKIKTAENEEEAGKGRDLVTNFLGKEEEEKESNSAFEMSDKFLRDSIMSLLAAGRDTSSIALTWFFWLVTTNSSVENKIREEIKTHLQLIDGEKWRFFNPQELNKLVYLHATLCETLRLYPPVPFNHKAAVKPDILPSGHHVEKDMEILFSVYAMARMEKIWGEDCMEFKPERWISERGDILHFPSYKFVAFGAGPRSCAGKDLAFIQMKTVAAAVLWNYRLQMVEEHIVSPSSSVILRMEHGLKMKVAKRYE